MGKYGDDLLKYDCIKNVMVVVHPLPFGAFEKQSERSMQKFTAVKSKNVEKFILKMSGVNK